jgi:hypothetical protein
MKTHKICSGCGENKTVDEYNIQRQGKKGPVYFGKCRLCLSTYSKKKYKETDSKVLRERRRKNPCNNTEWRKKHKLKKHYGLTLQDFSAMILDQDNKCKICKCEMKKPQVDHCHKTGKVRALLCFPCNSSLGVLKENTDTLYNMISYINDYI